MDKIGNICEYIKKNVNNIYKNMKWYFSEIFHVQFCFDMFYAVKSSEVEMT